MKLGRQDGRSSWTAAIPTRACLAATTTAAAAAAGASTAPAALPARHPSRRSLRARRPGHPPAAAETRYGSWAAPAAACHCRRQCSRHPRAPGCQCPAGCSAMPRSEGPVHGAQPPPAAATGTCTHSMGMGAAWARQQGNSLQPKTLGGVTHPASVIGSERAGAGTPVSLAARLPGWQQTWSCPAAAGSGDWCPACASTTGPRHLCIGGSPSAMRLPSGVTSATAGTGLLAP